MIYEKEIKCLSNKLCTLINNEMFHMFGSVMTYGFKNKLFKEGASCTLPVKITLKIELLEDDVFLDE